MWSPHYWSHLGSPWQRRETSHQEGLLGMAAWVPVVPFHETSIKLEKLSRTTISKHCKMTKSTQQIEKLLFLKNCWSFGEAQQESVVSWLGAASMPFHQLDWPELCF